jgi:hypothetical protein
LRRVRVQRLVVVQCIEHGRHDADAFAQGVDVRQFALLAGRGVNDRGLVRSRRKKRAARENAKLGGWPKGKPRKPRREVR